MEVKFRKIDVVSYGNTFSRGARNLAAELKNETPRVFTKKRDETPTGWYSPAGNSGGGILVVNWGGRTLDRPFEEVRILNRDVSISSKLNFFSHVNNYNVIPDQNCVRIPDWTVGRGEAQRWLDAGVTVVARSLLNSHSGNGIKIFYPGEIIQDASVYKLYTQYVKKRDEYRVHVSTKFGIFLAQKKLRLINLPEGAEDIYKVRNHKNGWVYSRILEEDLPGDVFAQAVYLRKALKNKLDFFAADIIYNESQHKAYVLEINTAPGIEGGSVRKYADIIMKYYKEGIETDEESNEDEEPEDTHEDDDGVEF